MQSRPPEERCKTAKTSSFTVQTRKIFLPPSGTGVNWKPRPRVQRLALLTVLNDTVNQKRHTYSDQTNPFGTVLATCRFTLNQSH
ncbi:hypothetical protein LF1_45420 [Rubripirellula obstinata]|uniref:Uncharacterized protein n=1 Tax=Rubripirellula obstinata TaxID=406547 RepID=A0A5B1CP09_9BACT|nr:hypothetical protein LF1_45420 [Rubripirellula obstinata]